MTINVNTFECIFDNENKKVTIMRNLDDYWGGKFVVLGWLKQDFLDSGRWGGYHVHAEAFSGP